MIETKTCKKCQKELPVSEFYFRKEKGVYRGCCKKCKSVNTKDEVRARVTSNVKICKHCSIEKPISEFQKSGGGKWLQPYCKPCDAERKKEHRYKNIERLKEKGRSYYLENKDAILNKDKQERLAKRPDTLKRIKELIDAKKMSPQERKRRKSECDKRYRENNRDKILIVKRKHYALKGNEQAKAWQKKMMNNVEFRTKKRLRGRIYVALKRGVKSESTMKLLGCSIEYFKTYFESLFTKGMSWPVYLSGGIHIDHIVPCKNFDLTDPEQQKKCFHYTNLQPLWEADNLRKGASLDYNKKAA